MGTRAAFWIGDPRDEKGREWIGCKAWDGYPQNPALLGLTGATTADAFRAAVAAVAAVANDFAPPSGGWPYPWTDDVFLTDFTYAFFDGGVWIACFHHGFQPAFEVMREGFEWPEGEDPTLRGVAIDRPYDRSQPDSIMFIRIP